MARETKKITTKNGHEVEVKTYLTYEEAEAALKISDDKFESASKMLEAAVVSLDGNAETIPARLKQLPLADYTELTKIVTEIVGGDFPSAK